MLNLVRPAVVRQYYGLQIDTTNIRCTYPLMSSLGKVSVGTDPQNFVTRPMCPLMKGIGNRLHDILLQNKERFNLMSVDISEPFNHCTILMYYADQNNERKASMGIHSDCTYNTKDTKFDLKRNSQLINTPTVVLSLGDARTLKWKRRHLIPKLCKTKGGKSKVRNVWHDDPLWDTRFELEDNTVTIINPGDENPRSDKNDYMRSQYMHGGVSVTGNKLAYGLVYRRVVGRARYDNATNRMIQHMAETPIDYAYLHDEFDGTQFHENLSSRHLNLFY